MDRLIEADEYFEVIRDDLEIRGESFRRAVDHLREMKTVDAVEVAHGKWLQGYPVHCSVCGGPAATEYEDANRYEAWLTPYCPNCGARMDGGN
jgi:hypothetical protein